jgi:hypothetical protein
MIRVLAMVTAVAALATGSEPPPEEALAPPVSLRGSPQAMQQQHAVAVQHGLSFFRTRAEIEAAVARGELVLLPGNEDYEVADFVDPPYALPEARLWVERTASLYRAACGERLVVTSAVRAMDEQPPNAHALSVHPAGMAIDLRISQTEECRRFLEQKMLELEEQHLINGIRERRPPHYHVAIFPTAYTAYAQERMAAEAAARGPDSAIPTPGEQRGVAGGLLVLGGILLAGIWLAWHLRIQRRASASASADQPPPEDR